VRAVQVPVPDRVVPDRAFLRAINLNGTNKLRWSGNLACWRHPNWLGRIMTVEIWVGLL
jgi:hypothetical protein